MVARRTRLLPGFGPSLGSALACLSLIVHILLSVGFIKAAGTSAEEFWNATASPRVVTDYKLSFAASLLAASINAVFGLIPARAWTAKRQGRQF